MAPPTWELAAYTGDYAKGDCRLDDGSSVRVVLQWSRGAPGKRDLEASLRRYAKVIRSRSGRRCALESLGEENLPQAFREGKTIVAFRWSGGDMEALGAMWRCSECGRSASVEVRFPANDAAGRREAREVIASVEDHPGPEGTVWSAYGFAFMTPQSYNLLAANLLPGRLRFLFAGARRDWLRVERWSMASELLRKVSLEAWPTELLKLSRVRWMKPLRIEPQSDRALPCVAMSGRISAGGIRRFFAEPTPLSGLAILDETADRIYAVYGAGKAESLEALADVCATAWGAGRIVP